jgi:type I restriction enzyme, S subunit
MKSSYKRIGDFIHKIDVRNKYSQNTKLLGLSMTKEFRPHASNIIGTDLSNYKVVDHRQFACDFMSTIRVRKLPIVMQNKDEKIIVSPAYTTFEIIDSNQLDPEYLMMWFRREEFDRYAYFCCDSAVRGGFNWDELCDVKLPIPAITKQREIVNEYNAIINYMKLNEKLTKKLEETAQSIYRNWFVDFEFPDENGQPYKSSGGKMVYAENLDKEIPYGWQVSGLSLIAEYLNGAAMQKYPPESNYDFMPVLKIRELNLGKTDDKSDRASLNIPENFKIKTGDVIFSWSGTLVIDIWTDGLVALNQHLFKVSSSKFSKWFYYLSTKYYIKEFIRIAEGNKTSMGHIKREHLDSSYVTYPGDDFKNTFDKYFDPIIEEIQHKKIENNLLSSLESLLLSKMSKI